MTILYTRQVSVYFLCIFLRRHNRKGAKSSRLFMVDAKDQREVETVCAPASSRVAFCCAIPGIAPGALRAASASRSTIAANATLRKK
jgi:hypothetical protein